ncbi:hypothetical protein FW784_12910, partial [Lysobacter lacus]
MFKPCPKCGFLVALIAGREASQRCPRCGSALLSESDLLEIAEAPASQPAPTRESPRVATAPPPNEAPDVAAEQATPESGAPVADTVADAHAGDADVAAPHTGVADAAPAPREGP